MKKLVSIVLFISLFALSFALSSCKVQEDNNKFTVAVTILPQKAYIKAIAGDLVNVIEVIPKGGSPETYEPSVGQIEKLHRAKLYFTIGVPAENAKILPEVKGQTVINTEVRVAKAYPDRLFDANSRDPHTWLSIKRVVVMVDIMAEELALADPDNAQTYKDNARDYISELNETEEYIKTILDSVPGDSFLVFHPSFGYFAQDYGLTMYSLEEEGKEASPKHLQDMITLAKDKGITKIFKQLESGASQPTAVAEEIGGSVVILDPLSEDYIANIKYMAEQIAEGLR